MTEYEAFVRDAAARRGIDPDIAVKVFNAEGGLTEPARVGKFETGWSFWAPQLHYAMAGQPGVTKPTAGMGEGFTKLTGWQPGDPKAWRDAARYALNGAKARGWGAWYGAAAVGVGTWDGIDRSPPWVAADERWDYETGDAPMPAPAPNTPLPYHPDAPIDAQPDDWSCAIQAVQWLLRSIGRNPDASDPKGDPWLRSQLVPSHVTPELGLLDGKGRELAAWITATYGAEMGFTAYAAPVTFDDVAAGAGVNPTLIGGRVWNHWSGVRNLTPDGEFALANPSHGWQGVGQTMSRAQWDALGDWHAIYIDRLSALPAPVPPAFDRAAIVAALRAILSRHDEYDRAMRTDLAGLLALAERA